MEDKSAEDSNSTLECTYTCVFPGCTKSFRKKSKLDRHILTHSTNKSFVCPSCDHSFKRKDHLKRHALSHSPDGKKFYCPYPDCSSGGFVDNYHLKRHIACVHDAPIKCSICGVTFEKKWLLAKHQHLIHGEKAPYQCDTCGKYFYTAAHYQDHSQKNCCNTKRKTNEEKQMENIGGHKRSKPETSVLDKSNNENKGKKEKVYYKCPYENCGAYLSTGFNLRVHIQKHHKRIATEKCTVEGCNACYLHKKSLKEHMRKVHQIV